MVLEYLPPVGVLMNLLPPTAANRSPKGPADCMFYRWSTVPDTVVLEHWSPVNCFQVQVNA